MDNSYRLLDLTVYGRQEMWEDSPTGWPQRIIGKAKYPHQRTSPALWSRLKAGYSEDLGLNTSSGSLGECRVQRNNIFNDLERTDDTASREPMAQRKISIV
jgi:hypothetical protein